MSDKKDLLILAPEEDKGKELAEAIRKSKHFNVVLNSYRSETIEQTTHHEYQALIFYNPCNTKDIDFTVRYIAMLEQCPIIYIVAEDLDAFRKVVEKNLDFDVRLLTLPRSNEEIAQVIVSAFHPQEFSDIEEGKPLPSRFFKIFIDATSEVFREFLGEGEITYHPPYLLEQEFEQKTISSQIGFIGQSFTGQIIFSMEESSYLKVYEKMVGEEHQSLNDENKDFICEIVNMIYGKAKVVLETMEYKLDMAFPTPFEDKIFDGPGQVIAVAFESEIGAFYLMTRV